MNYEVVFLKRKVEMTIDIKNLDLKWESNATSLDAYASVLSTALLRTLTLAST